MCIFNKYFYELISDTKDNKPDRIYSVVLDKYRRLVFYFFIFYIKMSSWKTEKVYTEGDSIYLSFTRGDDKLIFRIDNMIRKLPTWSAILYTSRENNKQIEQIIKSVDKFTVLSEYLWIGIYDAMMYKNYEERLNILLSAVEQVIYPLSLVQVKEIYRFFNILGDEEEQIREMVEIGDMDKLLLTLNEWNSDLYRSFASDLLIDYNYLSEALEVYSDLDTLSAHLKSAEIIHRVLTEYDNGTFPLTGEEYTSYLELQYFHYSKGGEHELAGRVLNLLRGLTWVNRKDKIEDDNLFEVIFALASQEKHLREGK